ncbi:MAG: hypothetical protein ABJB01_03990 [Rudaea sp.]
MCESPATSREHAPPRCVFPELSDFGADERRNLITVPSCDRHNSEKKKDDEFFRTALTMMSGPHNKAAEHIFFRKVLKAQLAAPATYRRFFRDSQLLTDGQPAMRLNRARFDECVDHLTRAIYFHTYGTKWNHVAIVASPSFNEVDASGRAAIPENTIAASVLTRQFLAGRPIKGDNPNVFEYCIRVENEFLGLAIRFYQSVEIYVASSAILALEWHAARSPGS